jgi:hypothetical protein
MGVAMAKKDKGGDINFDIDNMDDLDWPDFDFDDAFEEPKDDRSPVRKVASTAMKSVGKTIADPGRIRKTLTKTMPGAYSDVVGVGFDTASSMKDIFDVNMGEVQKTKTDMQKTLRRTLPKVRGSLPDKLGKFLDKIAGEDDSYGNYKSKEQERQEDIASKLDEIMGIQNDQAVADKETAEARRIAGEVNVRKRFTTQMAAFGSMDTTLRQLRDYNEGVDARWKRKSLELQLNQNFMMADLVDNVTRATADTLNRLDLIVKNTALPEAVKITKSEEFTRLTQQRLLGQVSQALSGNLGDYLAKTTNNIKGRVTRTIGDKLRSARDGFRGGADAAGDVIQMQNELKQQGGEDDSLQTILDLGLGVGSDWVVNKYGDRVKAKFGQHDKFNSRQGMFRNVMTNGGRWLDEQAGKRENDGTVKGFFKDLGRSLLHTTQLETSLKGNDLQQGHMPDNFNQLTNRSIIDVIPGLLARIHHEVVKFRTGDEDVPMIRYDATSGVFTDSKSMVKRVVNQFMTEGQDKYNVEGLDKIIKEIDPDGELKGDGRKALQRHLAELNMRNRKFDVKALANGGAMYGPGSAAGKAAVRDLLSKRFGRQVDGSFTSPSEDINNKEADIGNLLQGMRHNFQDPMPMIKTLVDAGYKEELIAAGLLNEKDGHVTLNLDAINDLRLGEGQAGQDFGPRAYSPKGRQWGGGGKGAGNKAINNLSTSLQQFTNQQLLAQQNRSKQPLLPTGGTINYNLMGEAMAKALQDTKAKNDDDACCGPIDEYMSRMDKIIEALQSMNDTYNSGYQTLVLEEIMDILTDGRQQANVVVSDDLFIVNGKQLGTEGAVWKNRGKRALTGARDMFGKARKAVGNRLTSARQTAGKALSFGKDKMGQLATFADNWKGQIVDVYVKGWERAALEARKIELGMYRDKVTGKIIKKLSDITGEVEELMDDGTTRIVLTIDDIKKGLHDRLGRRVVMAGIKNVKDLGKNLFERVSGAWGNLAGKITGAFKSAKDWAWGKMTELHDVYVAGEDTPRLLKFVLQNGGYIDKATNKVITKLSDIKGDVVDLQGNLVLSLDDMRKGLVDQYGEKVKANWLTAVSRVKAMGNAAWENGKKLYTGLKNFGKGVLKRAKGFGNWALSSLSGLGGKINRWLSEDSGANGILSAQLEVQTAILEQIAQMNPANKKRKTGDRDGDGVVEGSWQDILAKRNAKSEKDKDREAMGAGGAGKAAAGGGLLAALGDKLKGLFGGKKKEEDEEGGLDLQDAANAADLAEHGKKGLGKLWNKTKGAGRWLRGKLGRIPGVGRLGGMLSRIPGVGALRGAVSGLGARGAIGLGLRTAGGWALRGALGAGAVAAGIVSAPVMAAVGIAMAVGTVAWLAYKWYDASKDRPLQRLRLAQYGWDGKDSDVAKKMLAFEEKILKHTKVTDGKIDVGAGGDDAIAALKEFDIDPEKPRDLKFRSFQEWYDKRFRLVFDTWVMALNKVDASAKLPEVDDKLNDETKKTLLELVKTAGSAGWTIGSAPGEDMNMLTDPSAIKALADAAVEKFGKANAKTDLPLPEGGNDKARQLAAEAAALGTGVAGAAVVAEVAAPSKVMTTQQTMGSAAAVMAVGSVTPVMAGALAMSGGTRPTSGSAANEFPTSLLPKGPLDPLRTIRMRAYGLITLDVQKVHALLYLEWAAQQKMRASSDGSADYTGTLEDLIGLAGAKFGVGQPGSESFNTFKDWLNYRFLPVYKAYVGALKAVSGNTDPLLAHVHCKPTEQYKLAEAVISAGSYYKDNFVAIWKVPLSPYYGDAPNMDSSTAADNMKALIKDIEKQQLDEVAGESGKVKSGLMSKTKDFFSGAVDSVKNFFGAGGDKGATPSSEGGNWFTNMFKGPSSGERTAGGNLSDTYNQNKTDLYNQGVGGKPGEYNAQNGGGVGLTFDPNGGSAGNVNDLPMPTSRKGFDAHKELIAAVAKMTGVDPGVLAGLMATESGFDSSVKSSMGGSATGLGQFITGTWKAMIKKHGAKFGIKEGTDPNDPRANALMTVMYMKDNMESLKGTLNRPLTDVDAYMAHFLGSGGYKTALKNLDKYGADVMPKEAGYNKPIFYVGGDKSKPRTFRQIIDLMAAKQVGNRNKFGSLMYSYMKSKGEKVDDSMLRAGEGVNPLSSTEQTVAGQPKDTGPNPDASAAGNAPTTGGPVGEQGKPSVASMARDANSGGADIAAAPGAPPELLKTSLAPTSSGGGSSGGGGGDTGASAPGTSAPSPSQAQVQAEQRAAQAAANTTSAANTSGAGIDKLIDIGSKSLQLQQQQVQLLQIIAAQSQRAPATGAGGPMSVKAPTSV